ncbi:putative uncharacterized protein DDB_G0290989 isoform X1 [Drosophila rhopaloa]|uniref:Uncharacterized protein n=1 Tax=Drosophila rhopaloa TaxID=1041015 RepID=A0ABM5H0T8_DRORH|nr:putative uncharacterized protein DDB_G0290989 isoform X1 [Drosophila rhopaloa]
MVLRSGIIIPFQFRDTKKLLMIGVPEENRNLNIWDLKNVVRAAFGIYNFEFRNKKIGFNIPDELLLHYLAQRHDLTNFVIEISQVYDVALDNYVLNRQCRCADQKMLNDSPTPEEPTNLCQPSNVLEAAPTPLMALPPCDDEEHDHEHEHEESMKYRIDKASSGAASAELGMPAYEACSPKMDYDTQDELPDSPHSQPLPPPPLPAALPLPPPPTSHPQHLQQQQHDEEQQQLLQERIQHEYMIQQQQQHQHLQQQHQHLALLQQQQHEQQQQQQQHPQQQHGVNMAIGTTTTNNIRQRKERMSKRQKELYVHFLQQHQFINDHRRNDPVLDPYWLKLANLLNAVPQGAVKHVTEWKQTFDNWRYRIFLYARYNSKLQDEEAQNPRNFKPLTRTDKQAYIMWIRNPDTAPPDLDKMRNVFCNLEETVVQQE